MSNFKGTRKKQISHSAEPRQKSAESKSRAASTVKLLSVLLRTDKVPDITFYVGAVVRCWLAISCYNIPK